MMIFKCLLPVFLRSMFLAYYVAVSPRLFYVSVKPTKSPSWFFSNNSFLSRWSHFPQFTFLYLLYSTIQPNCGIDPNYSFTQPTSVFHHRSFSNQHFLTSFCVATQPHDRFSVLFDSSLAHWSLPLVTHLPSLSTRNHALRIVYWKKHILLRFKGHPLSSWSDASRRLLTNFTHNSRSSRNDFSQENG